MRSNLIPILLLLLPFGIHAQDAETDKIIAAGNNYYISKQFEEAETQYRKALTKSPELVTAKFNLANTLYKLHKEKEAIALFAEISRESPTDKMVPETYYNRGVVQTKLHALEESIQSYKEALRKNPADKDARENLQKALLELKKKNPPKKDPEKKNNPKQKPQSKMNSNDADRRLKQLEEKEKEVQQRLQKEKSKSGGGLDKDW